ncbi:MAG: hypothetical protein C9356_10690 [Oleiphilus sp.]|nr:MAG: hypothetical protein C9356_10690 [Oleiphilus sp.]
MMTRTLKSLAVLFSLLCLCFETFAGYRTYLDPRSMALGGTGVASATKFNASYHNPALIAFNRGDKPDKIYISASQGLREIHTGDFEKELTSFQNSGLTSDFIETVENGSDQEILEVGNRYRDALRNMNLTSYRKDELSAFNLLADTRPITVNFYVRSDYREMTTIRNLDETLLEATLERADDPEQSGNSSVIGNKLSSTVDDTTYQLTEFGGTVATTNVIDYNIPISWGFTPKLIQINASHQARKLAGYSLNNRPSPRVSNDFLEWNLDVGFAALLTDAYLREVFGLDGWWLEGEWVVGLTGMNLFPTDFTPFFEPRNRGQFPGKKTAVQALYQFGLAHYREDYMITMDIDLTENEVYDFEGLTRFISFGGEYFWRDDFHLRAGVRFNAAQTMGAGQEKALLTGGFLYQPHGFSVEASALINDVEKGGTVGFGLAF